MRKEDLGYLALICFISLGARFSDSLPDSLPDEFRQVLTRNSTADRLLLDSLYSWPNIVLPLIGGMLIDKYLGINLGTTLACLTIAVGSSVLSFAASIPALSGTDSAFELAMTGWLLFSFGEIMYIGQQKLAANRFGQSYFATALGITNCFGQLCTTLNYALLPSVVRYFSFSTALWTASFTCYISVCASLWLFRIDKLGQLDAMYQPLSVEDAHTGGVVEVVTRVFGVREWLMCVICALLYMALSQFFSIGNKLLQLVYGLTEAQAARLLSLPYVIEAFSLPFVAHAVDRVGYPVYWLFVAAVMITATHFVLATVQLPAVFVVVWFAIGRTVLSASFWPMIAYVVPKRLLATGYGLVISCQNLGLAIAPIIIRTILPDYVAVELLLTLFGLLAVGLCVVLYYVDKSSEGVLTSRRPVAPE